MAMPVGWRGPATLPSTHPPFFPSSHRTSLSLLQLACARVSSPEGQDYLAAMAAAANYAWVNRSSMTFLTRQAFAKQFGKVPHAHPSAFCCPHPSLTSTDSLHQAPDELDMHVIYDVSHNIAKVPSLCHSQPGCPRCPRRLAVWGTLRTLTTRLTAFFNPPIFPSTWQVEQHMVDGQLKTLLVHRKGSTRAFPPHHPLIPVDYQVPPPPPAPAPHVILFPTTTY